jgi:hypothetical protein
MTFATIPVGELYSNHITQSDGEVLTSIAKSRAYPFVVAEFDTGWFLQVAIPGGGWWPDDNQEMLAAMTEFPFSTEFLDIARTAQAAGLAFLRIHADAEPTEGLATFDW